MVAHGFSSKLCLKLPEKNVANAWSQLWHLTPEEAGDWWALLECGEMLWVWEP